MEILPLTADDDDLLEQAAAHESAVRVEDCPWFPPETKHGVWIDVAHGWDGEPDDYWVGVEGGQVVARGSMFAPRWDNPRLAWLGTSVHPAHRRRGLGSAMLEHVTAQAVAAGRSVLGTDAWEGSPGAGFAERRGFVLGSRSIMRRQHLTPEVVARARVLLAEAAAVASSYELVRVVGETPEDLLPAVVDLTGAINDAPNDDLAIEDEVFTAERLRAYERAQRDSGMRLRRLLARHRDTGELAGHTIVSVSGERPWRGWQHDTSVARAHRGRRLGLLLKSAMVDWLATEEPQLEQVETWNAESNDHMIAVNEELGYRWMGRQLELQRTL